MCPISKPQQKQQNLDGEYYTEMWLSHYYHVRYFQPCRQVASFIAGRLTGEYHEGNNVSKEEDLARLCAAQKILAAESNRPLAPDKIKGQE